MQGIQEEDVNPAMVWYCHYPCDLDFCWELSWASVNPWCFTSVSGLLLIFLNLGEHGRQDYIGMNQMCVQ
jgi:hypothetical protein